jgi:NAD(P)H-hydrate epimerase
MYRKDHTKELVLSREEVRACDAVAIERYGMEGIVLMENAGAAAARHADTLMRSDRITRVCIIAGVGNNGGDGFVVARHLYNLGYAVHVIICGTKERIKGDAYSNLQIIEKMNVSIFSLSGIDPAVVKHEIQTWAGECGFIIDALLGTGTAGPPREPILTAIETINALGKPILSLDIPSGLDCDTGEPLEVAIRAEHTVTFAAMKKGFLNPSAARFTGKVTVASIGIKTDLLKRK